MAKKAKAAADTHDLSLEGRKPVKPRTENQRLYLNAIRTADMTFGLGPAGAGKTYLSATYAAEQLASGDIERIIITRPTATIDDEQFGFLPGDLNKKMEPWVAEIFDAIIERVGLERAHGALKSGAIRIIPFAFMRGRTFKNAFVLVDEAQNMSPAQAKALVTRIGENCRYSISGDLTQTDKRGLNGLRMLTDMVERRQLPYPIIRFTESDCVRSKACRIWLDAFKADEPPPEPTEEELGRLPCFVTRLVAA